MNAAVVGPLDIAAARGRKLTTKREFIVNRAIAREIPRNTQNMPKTFDIEYAKGLVEFKNRLAVDLQAKAGDKATVIVNVEQGRKFDKVMVAVTTGTSNRVNMEVRYFVDHRNGAILGPKSPLSPNLNHYYGTIYECGLWDWSAERAVPYDADKAGVVAVKTYGSNRKNGGYIRYLPKSLAQSA
jgi:hypothetical protein